MRPVPSRLRLVTTQAYAGRAFGAVTGRITPRRPCRSADVAEGWPRAPPVRTRSVQLLSDGGLERIARGPRRTGCDVREIPVLPVVEMDGKRVDCPRLSLYACNGAVIVPLAGVATDADALSVVEPAFPGRDVVAVKATMFASRGGGPH